jgi:hypothetical protein
MAQAARESVRVGSAAPRAIQPRQARALPGAGLVQRRMPTSDHGMSGTCRQANESGPLMIRMLAQVVPEVQMVEIVMMPGQEIPGFPSEPWSVPGLDKARSRIRARVLRGLLGQSALHSFSSVVAGVSWRVLVEPIHGEGGEIVGALFVARQGRVWASGSAPSSGHSERCSAREQYWRRVRGHCSWSDAWTGWWARSPSGSCQRLHILAKKFSRGPCGPLRILWVDIAVVRRHDYSRELSVIEAQWPATAACDYVVPTAVGFDADPATRVSCARAVRGGDRTAGRCKRLLRERGGTVRASNRSP